MLIDILYENYCDGLNAPVTERQQMRQVFVNILYDNYCDRLMFVNILYDNYCDGLNAPESVKGKQLRHSKLSNNRISRLHAVSCHRCND